MKKILLTIAAAALLLSGCAAEETFETISDHIVQPVLAEMRQISVVLPAEAASPTVESDSGRIYLCQDYEISIQTLESGDLRSTVSVLSGYDMEALTVMATQKGDVDCYRFVWASAGENGDRVGQAMILDDGSYHYCLSVLGDADTAQQNQLSWEEMFGSFSLN